MSAVLCGGHGARESRVMHSRMKKVATGILLLALVLPGSAVAASITVPPGNSEADQYFETVPGSSGGRSPDTSKTAEDAVREGRLTAATLRALERRGEVGQAVADVVAQTGPPGGKAGGSGLGAAAFEAPDKQGLGALFPIILVATAVGAVAYAVGRRRGSTAK